MSASRQNEQIRQSSKHSTIQNRPMHGGDILEFCAQKGIQFDDCIDLSTGIAPWSWPVPGIPRQIWQALPTSTEYESTLLRSASDYYQCASQYLLPVPGSQAAIESIPRLAKPDAKIACPHPGYEEHRFAWQNSGAEIFLYRNTNELLRLVSNGDVDHAVLINPNNPTTEIYRHELIEQLRISLQNRAGFLVVDEAFVDPNPELSHLPSASKPGLIVLRSIGKFFGLAGLRLGFVCAAPTQLERLHSIIGLWKVSTPALWLGSKMLSDNEWIQAQQVRCCEFSGKLNALVSAALPQLEWHKTNLFVTGIGQKAQVLDYRSQLADVGIHSRYISINQENSLLRLGLADEKGLKRMAEIRR